MDGFDIIKIIVAVLLLVFVLAIVGFARTDYTDTQDLMLPVVVVSGFALLAAVVLWGMAAADGVTCKNQAAKMGLPYDYGFSTPCLVNDNGRWIPIDQVINNREESS